jgi:hypothetical protein
MNTNEAGGAGADDPVAEQLARIRDLLEQARELFRLGEISLAISVRNAAVRLHGELDQAVYGPLARGTDRTFENRHSRR